MTEIILIFLSKNTLFCFSGAYHPILLQVISCNSPERQPESLIIGKRKPSLEFQFQNKFRLGGDMLGGVVGRVPRGGGGNVILRQGKMIGGIGGGGGHKEGAEVSWPVQPGEVCRRQRWKSRARPPALPGRRSRRRCRPLGSPRGRWPTSWACWRGPLPVPPVVSWA